MPPRPNRPARPPLSPSFPRLPRSAAAALVALGVLGSLALRLPGMTESLWWDEVYRTHLRLNTRDAAWVLHDVHNPLYNAFMLAWTGAFGDSEVSIRLPSLLAGYASLLVFCGWARRRFGEAPAALVLAWGLLSPVHVWYSTEAKNNMFSVFFAVLVLLAYDALREDPRPRRVAAAVGAGLLAVATDFVTLLTLVPACAAVAWAVARRPVAAAPAALPSRPWAAPLAAAVTLGTASPWVAFKAAHAAELRRTYMRHFNARELWMLLCDWLPTGNAIVPAWRGRGYTMGVVGAVVLLPLLWLGLRSLRRAEAGRVVGAVLIAPLVFYLLASAWVEWRFEDEPYFYQERNLLILLYPYGLTVSMGALSLRRRSWRVVAAGAVLAMGAAGTGLMLTVHDDTFTVMTPNPDWRGAARLIAPGGGPSDGRVYSTAPPDALVYYNPALAPSWVYDVPGNLDRIEREVRESGAGGATLLVVREWGDLDEAGWARLRERFEVGEIVTLRRIQVCRIGVRGRGGR